MDPSKLRDIQEERSGQNTPLQPQEPQEPIESPTIPSAHASKTRPRRGSSVSRVSIDYFDPQGVRELQRTLSKMTQRPGSPAQSTSSDSNATLANEAPFDFEKALRQITEKREEAHISPRELGVVFEDLHVVGLGSGASYQETIGSTLNPLNIFKQIQSARHPHTRSILSGFEGVVKPGEMLLVLGRPGSGCSTLLKTLANQTQEYHSVGGTVNYDSLSPKETQQSFRGDVQYCPEDDVHFPSLTVEDTLRFAAKTRAPQVRTGETRAEYVTGITEMLMTIFGLRHARRTPVGDAAIRGVSGGEKKRVSIAEALATRMRLGSWDNSTRGLDASTALEFGRALRIATDIARLTNIVSIYQASETLYNLFDKVCVIYEGRMAYFGPADQARQYFIDLGYEPANRQTTPDFLVSVTDPLGRIPRQVVPNRPKTAEEFAMRFKESTLGALNKKDMSTYRSEAVLGEQSEKANAYRQSASQEKARHTRTTSPYLVSLPMQARAVIQRRVQILIGNSLATVFALISFIIQGVIVGTVFLKVPESTSAYFSRGGVLFFALLFCALSSMAEIPSLFAQRPIIHRQKQAGMYHPFIESVALTVVDIPITFLNTAIFGIMIYFLVGLQLSAAQFFTFYLFLFTMTLTMKAWFRAIAALFKSEATAQAVAGLILLALVIYTGYTIPKPYMIGALRWISYINPLRYGFEAVLTNEFHTLDGTCASLVPQGPGYENVALANQVCTTVGSVSGSPTVNGNTFVNLSYSYSFSNTWMNFGILVAFAGLFLATLFIFSEFNTTLAEDSTRTLFKRGSEAPVVAASGSNDEEKGVSAYADEKIGKEAKEAKEALTDAPAMTEVFSWKSLNYVVPVAEGQRKLLDDISGFVIPGKLTALMGESGAGKTTLLNVLAQRVSTGVVTGEMLVSGQSLPRDFQAQTGYCQQMDTHVGTDTVREALLLSAKLRQPASVPLAEKEAYVETCLKMCGLEEMADAIVGTLGVEHRKRTTIAVELAAKPKLLLFLDEPTSGLDSQSAWAIMDFLRSLSAQGQAILCTIHQPSAELFQVFDRLLLLRKGGQTVYFGDLGHNATTLIQYFERNGSRHCDPTENPAEFMLDVIGAGATATTDRDWHDIWKKTPEAKVVQDTIAKIYADGKSRPPVATTLHSEYATGWMNQFVQLVKRDMLFRYRNPTYLIAKLVLNIFGGLFIGFTFWKAKNTQQGTQNKLFAIYMGTIISVPVANSLQVPFLNMRKIYEIRERPSRMYHWSALVTAQFVAEIPWNMLGSSLFFFCWYWTVGFPSSRAGYTYLLLGVIFPFYYVSFADAVAAMVPNAEIAALLFSLLFSFVLTFNGVLQPFSQLGWWQWMYHLSPYTYVIEGLLGQAIGKQSITCSDVELVTLEPPSGQTCSQYMSNYINFAGGYLTNPDATSNCHFCSTATTDQFLEASFNISYAHRWRDIGFLCAYILFNIACIYAFTWFFRIRTGSLLGSLKKRFNKK
ncbi:ABC transporter [Rhodocollybia butyracea]|uniref:ABC transporter n=1 Tax=Rhodocollybia butyracea TaxID=206335 RepID=A0A9P5Q821_9AGAR|nr:ABC transporter [Rhodocollybia butyracea]